MKISSINTGGKAYYKKQNNKYDTANITNVRGTDISRAPTRVYITREKVVGPGPGVPVTKEAIKHPEKILSQIKTYIDRDGDLENNYMFNKYIFDKKLINGPNRGVDKEEHRLTHKKPTSNMTTLEKIGRMEDYKNTFQGLTSFDGNRIRGRELKKSILAYNKSFQ